MSLNKVMLIGNVGKDPVIRHIENGGTTANFSLATTERYRDKNGTLQENTEWHNIVCWRTTAETVEKFVKRGTQLFVEGKLRYREWKDQNGQDRYTTEIIASGITLLGRKSDNAGGPVPYAQSNITPASAVRKEESNFEPDENSADVDDLPF
jgi:single-strand DNA-binding protein